jgi:hypothetical protein
MSSLPDPADHGHNQDQDQGPPPLCAGALRPLLERYGLHTVLEALSEAIQWRAHHFAAVNCYDVANRLNRAATALDWVAYTHARGLNDLHRRGTR